MTARIHPNLIQRLDVMAEKEKRSRSELIERAVEELLDRHDKAAFRRQKVEK